MNFLSGMIADRASAPLNQISRGARIDSRTITLIQYSRKAQSGLITQAS
jgi:hypothetical protein